MANLLDSVENSVWHAFDCLALEGDGTAPKSKLKVLTSKIGAVLDLHNAEKGLDDYRSTQSLTFDQYRYYLFKEVFSSMPDEMSLSDQHKYEAKLDEVFWSLCKPHFIERDNPVFPDGCIYQLYRIFCMLGEMVENDDGKIEVVMAAEEVENTACRFTMSLGRGAEWDAEAFDSLASVIQAFKFGIVLTVFESKYATDVDEGGIVEAITDIHDFFLLDVIKKGHLGKKMDLIPAFREHFFVLQPQVLTMFSGSSQREKRGEILLNAQCRAEPLPDGNSKSPLKKPPGAKSHSRFQLLVNEKIYEFQASDHRTRLQWLSSFKLAADHAETTTVRYQRSLAMQRKLARQEEKEKEVEEMLSQSTCLDETKMQLEQEKQARVNAEVQAATLKRQRLIEEKKMREMEKIKEQLEKLLDEERQAKKDEEIVRTLQARILNEEWARRETLEKLQEDQKKLLEEERKKREQFERLQQEKEKELKEAQLRVEEMERERRKLDKQLDTALEKTRAAYHGQEVLEAKIKIREQERDMELDKEATISSSKGNTLNPSASFYMKNRDRPCYMPMRSASMRETSYSRSIRRSRQKPSTNSSMLSVSNVTTGAAGSIAGEVAGCSSTLAIAEVNSNASGTEDY